MTPPDTIGSTLGAVAAALQAAGFDEARRRARRLLTVALDLSLSEVFVRLDRMITEDEGERVAAVLARAVRHEPLSRIAGVREFWGLEFMLSPDTLDPRPESETLVEAVLARLPDRAGAYRILDLGTGSGCLLLALLSELPAASGIGVDAAPGAVEMARRNAEKLGLAARSEFVVGHWAQPLGQEFDVVVANPPYIASADIEGLPPEVRDYDPRRALDGGADGLDAYRAMTTQLPRLLVPGGVFAGEFGQGQDGAVAELIGASGLRIDCIIPDLAGIPRCVVACRDGGQKMVGTGKSPA
ncbi:MAG TPA: peptide chain release factor N(5)-glutamine methyltransferase [Stellaceae bacterium]|nr:peptide chain release factor N(5)-glutamine methyltransferase [Stellaceae bacterium]